ncbi:TRAF-like [Arabidopsis suecica]|uniref:TRAF-like n=1 Tax=Arabidopsis suecica TaxID=45249 RepID=A0A8T2H9T3_ARASU|nr:TRAF-like [Arabidopsis suecica]
MEDQYEKKITWTIKDFSFVQSQAINSDIFVVGDSKWNLVAHPKGYGESINKCLSLYLNVADFQSLPNGWKRHIKYRLTVVNQMSEKLSEQEVAQGWFYRNSHSSGFQSMVPLTELLDVNGGFMVNGDVKIVSEVGVLEVVGKSDVLEETLLVHETIDVNGFQVLPSQVESVNNLFEKHPDIVSKFRLENPHLRTTYLNSLLCLTEILSQSTEKISVDLANAHSTLSCLTKAGFKLDWLETKLKELGKTRMQQLEQNLKDLKDLKQEF